MVKVMTPEDKAFCNKVLQLALCNPEMAWNTLDLTERVLSEGIPGDLAECGVFAGTHPAIMAYVLMKHGITDRKVHLFDSFEGIPKAQAHEHPNDLKTLGKGRLGVIESSGVSVCSLEGVKRYMKMWGIDPTLLVYHKGWFQNTLKNHGILKLALLRIDCDLYDSTIPVLQHLYPCVQPGGYVIDDDLGSPTCRQAVVDILGAMPKKLNFVSAGTHWWRV